MKRLLLDTHIFLLWLSDNYNELGNSVINAISDQNNEIFVSAATPWELSIKRSLGKIETLDDISSYIDKAGFTELPISAFHGEQAGELPPHHKDPFDRVMIAQAQAEGLVIVTNDSTFLKYGIRLMSSENQ